ncbi:unnamed protein product, partial [Rotaria sordida]
LPTLNLLQSDQSLLTTNQWTLLTNLFHRYKESQILPLCERLIDTHDASQSNYAIYKVLLEEFLVSLYETAGLYLRSNDDFRKLSSDDRSIILRNAADNVCCMSGTFVMQYFYLYGRDAKRYECKYAEVIWKYLLYKYGHYDAVKRYLNIILWLISMSMLTFHAQTLKPHINDLHSIIEQTELTLILDDVEPIIEIN